MIFSLTGCILSCGYVQDGIQDSEGAWPVTEPGLDPLPEGVLVPEVSFMSEEEIALLDSKQITWGPGSILDGQGRPEACVLLQNQYGKYSTWFLGEEEKTLYLTFDEGYENGYTAQVLDVLKRKNVTTKTITTIKIHFMFLLNININLLYCPIIASGIQDCNLCGIVVVSFGEFPHTIQGTTSTMPCSILCLSGLK